MVNGTKLVSRQPTTLPHPITLLPPVPPDKIHNRAYAGSMNKLEKARRRDWNSKFLFDKK
jgi:hypothetical protein